MGYIHKGKAMTNGAVDHAILTSDAAELAVQPEDDGSHISDRKPGNFEWWYFDILDRVSGCFLKIVMHVGTDPLKTRIFPQLAVSVNTPESCESFSHPYHIGEMEADTQQCRISIRNEIKIWANSSEGFIQIAIPRFKCNFRFTADVEGWKPLGKEIKHQIGKKKGIFSWVIPMPRARVEGEFSYDNRTYILHHATGYHDHNYMMVDERHPLHLDQLVIKWCWGKCNTDRYTVVFMDTWCRTNRFLSLLVAEDSRIIHSSNNLMNCSVLTQGYDKVLQLKYPASLIIKSADEEFRFQAEFESDRILDQRDLLEGVNPVVKYLIKKFVAKPSYHSILAKVKLRINDCEQEGYGNYESMVFREQQ